MFYFANSNAGVEPVHVATPRRVRQRRATRRVRARGHRARRERAPERAFEPGDLARERRPAASDSRSARRLRGLRVGRGDEPGARVVFILRRERGGRGSFVAPGAVAVPHARHLGRGVAAVASPTHRRLSTYAPSVDFTSVL